MRQNTALLQHIASFEPAILDKSYYMVTLACLHSENLWCPTHTAKNTLNIFVQMVKIKSERNKMFTCHINPLITE